MLGRDLFKVESNVELSNERFKSLVLFYSPLIGSEASMLYEFFVVKGTSIGFIEISTILNSLLMSIDKFEALIKKLNEYKLVRTYKSTSEEKYIFKVYNPLTSEEFIKNDIYVRNFIKKTSGEYYQSLLSGIRVESSYAEYEDVTEQLDLSILNNWSKEDETFLKSSNRSDKHNFNTFFNIDTFLSDISTILLPLRFRSEENLRQIATLADLYNIDYEKMRKFLPKVAKSNSDSFDLNMLRYLCENSECEYKKVKDGVYDIPCELFLLNKQDGKEVSPYDKKIIYELAYKYHLRAEVINVLLEHALKSSDNRLIEKYIYSIASDLNRNDVKTASEAKERLNSFAGGKNTIKSKKEEIPVYNDNNNPIF